MKRRHADTNDAADAVLDTSSASASDTHATRNDTTDASAPGEHGGPYKRAHIERQAADAGAAGGGAESAVPRTSIGAATAANLNGAGPPAAAAHGAGPGLGAAGVGDGAAGNDGAGAAIASAGNGAPVVCGSVPASALAQGSGTYESAASGRLTGIAGSLARAVGAAEAPDQAHLQPVPAPRPAPLGGGSTTAAATAAGAPAAPAPIVRSELRRRPVEGRTKQAIQYGVLELIFAGSGYDAGRYLGDRPELPGPLAVTLSRRTLAAVASASYFACEKSDGERAMLLAVPDAAAARASAPAPNAVNARSLAGVPAGAYLIDRTFDVYTLERGIEYAGLLARGGPTLLDGELIFRADDAGTGTGAKAVYMIFDAITFNGANKGAENFLSRMHCIGYGVGAFREADAVCIRTGRPALPLYLAGKKFVEKQHLRAVFDKVVDARAGGGSGAIGVPSHAMVAAAASTQATLAVGAGHGRKHQPGAALTAPLESEMEAGSAAAATATATATTAATAAAAAGHRLYRDGVRVNGTDGIIFTPADCSYTDMFRSATSATPLLKWKYQDENTVDFRLRVEDLEKDDVSSGASAGVAPPGMRHVPLLVSLGGRAGEQAVARTTLSLAECDAYMALADRLGVPSLIVECAYDVLASTWRIKRVRDRKTRANHIATAWQTLETMAEHITREELVMRLSATPQSQAGAGSSAGPQLPPAPQPQRQSSAGSY